MQELRTAPRQRRSQQSIGAILDAAERLIHEQGQVSFTANELASAAEMSIGRVYYWFPDMPSVVNALADRAAERLAELFRSSIDLDGERGAIDLVRATVSALCRHIDENPATVPLCVAGSGANDYGAPMRESMVETAKRLLAVRVPGVPEPEADLVARTGVGIMLGMLQSYGRATEAARPFIEQELVYVLAAWLHARYPDAADPVWQLGSRPVEASRPSVGGRAGGAALPAMHTATVRPSR